MVAASNIDLQQELSESGSVVRNILENVPAAIAIFDTDMKYIWASRRWYQDYLIKEPSVVGKSHYEVFPTIPERWKQIHQKALKGEVLSSDEDSFVDEDGKTIWNRWNITPWKRLDGSIGGIIMLTEVITHRKEAEIALQTKVDEMTTLLNSMTNRELKMMELKKKIEELEQTK